MTCLEIMDLVPVFIVISIIIWLCELQLTKSVTIFSVEYILLEFEYPPLLPNFERVAIGLCLQGTYTWSNSHIENMYLNWWCIIRKAG